MNLQRLVQDGVDRNIAIFDGESDKFSIRMLMLLCHAAKYYRTDPIGQPDGIILDYTVKPFIEDMYWGNDPEHEVKQIMGIPIQYIDGLDSNGHLVEYYKSIGGGFYQHRSNLVMAYNGDKCLLGMY